MAKVEGPLFSLEASGTIGDAITYSRWKGIPYARKRVIPANPKSAAQTGIRAMFAFVAAFWDQVAALDQATWNTLAAALNITPFNAYVRENQKRWVDGAFPTQAYPAAEASTGLTVTTQTLTGGAGFATIEITPSGSTDIWGLAIFRGTSALTAGDRSNLVKVLPADGANKVTYIDSNLPAGTYHYRTQVINVDGKIGTLHADDTADVT
jgi:hypothetical protein